MSDPLWDVGAVIIFISSFFGVVLVVWTMVLASGKLDGRKHESERR